MFQMLGKTKVFIGNPYHALIFQVKSFMQIVNLYWTIYDNSLNQ